MSGNINFKTSMEFEYGIPMHMGANVARIVANNPGPFTYKGTNTYLIGQHSLAVVDPGPDDAEHCTAILKAAGQRRITHILITHTHRDHVDGTARLQAATGAKTYSFARADNTPNPNASSPSGTEFVDIEFAPDVPVSHDQLIEGEDWTIRALHTPGHAPDHLCFALEGTPILMSGDHVMAWNTTVVAPPEGRMADYLKALELLLENKHDVYLPGHGGRIENPARMVKAYLLHRQWRERDILGAIRDGLSTVPEIVTLLYKDLDEKLIDAASLSVIAHAEHLHEKGLIAPADKPINRETPLRPA